MSEEIVVKQDPEVVPPSESVEAKPEPPKPADSASRTIFVKNISESATTKTLVDFFSFCGVIEHIKLHPVVSEEDKSQIAEITFETIDGANTALLLDNSLILDRPIKIVVSPAENAPEGEADKKEDDDDDKKESANIEDSKFMKNAATAVGGIAAETYAIGSGLKKAVIDVDSSLGFSAGVKKTANDIDEALGLSTKTTAAANYVNQKFNEFDNATGLSAAAHSAVATVQEAANNVAKTPVVSSTISIFKAWGNSLSRTYNLFQTSSNAAIQAKKEQMEAAKQQQQMSGLGEEEKGVAEEEVKLVFDDENGKKEENDAKKVVEGEEKKEEEEDKPALPPKPVSYDEVSKTD